MSGFIPTHGAADERTMAPIVEIVSAGNEVLIGDVLDTNTNWLCVRVTGLGGLVRRTVMLRDDIEAIAAEIRGALARISAAIASMSSRSMTVRRTRPPRPVTRTHSQLVLVSRTSPISTSLPAETISTM